MSQTIEEQTAIAALTARFGRERVTTGCELIRACYPALPPGYDRIIVAVLTLQSEAEMERLINTAADYDLPILPVDKRNYDYLPEQPFNCRFLALDMSPLLQNA